LGIADAGIALANAALAGELQDCIGELIAQRLQGATPP